MTIDVSLEVLVGAALFTGGQIAILAQVTRSNRDQGRRLGALERWQTGLQAVERDHTKRHRLPDSDGVPEREE